jgi:predicted  nucleic acid-binding Zn-ribbon protein
MASADLTRLYKLHLIDVGILEIKKKAVSLEAGKKLQTDLESLTKHVKGFEEAFHKAHAEQKDIELSNQQIDDKVKGIDKLLFGGSVTNAKEVEAYEAQKKSFAKQKDSNEERLLTVWDEVSFAETEFKKEKAVLDKQTASFNEWKAKAVIFKGQLESKYKELSSLRPKALQGIDPILIAKYESSKQQHHGIGVAIVTKQQTCEECGTKVSEKVIESIKDDRIVNCEECHRILYWTGGIV